MSANDIIDRLLEDASLEGDDAELAEFFHRALTELPEKHASLASPTIKEDEFTAALRVVLHRSHASRHGREEWVTHLENMQVGGMSYGHYTTDYEQALADYKKRCENLRVDWKLSTVVDD